MRCSQGFYSGKFGLQLKSSNMWQVCFPKAVRSQNKRTIVLVDLVFCLEFPIARPRKIKVDSEVFRLVSLFQSHPAAPLRQKETGEISVPCICCVCTQLTSRDCSIKTKKVNEGILSLRYLSISVLLYFHFSGLILV